MDGKADKRGSARQKRAMSYKGFMFFRAAKEIDGVPRKLERGREERRNWSPVWTAGDGSNAVGNGGGGAAISCSDEAIKQFQETLAMDPNFPLAYFGIGRAYGQLKIRKPSRS